MPRGYNSAGDVVQKLADGTPTNNLFNEFGQAAAAQNAKRDGLAALLSFKTAAARRVNGDADGTRELVDVLLLHRSLPAPDVTAGITAALSVGAVSADVVALEARRHADQAAKQTPGLAVDGDAGGATRDRQPVAQRDSREQRVVSLTQRRLMDPAAIIAGLPPDTRPLPTVDAYDELIPRRRTIANATSDAPTMRASTS
jgi:hypothetical protein